MDLLSAPVWRRSQNFTELRCTEEACLWAQLQYSPRVCAGDSRVNSSYTVGDGEQLAHVKAEGF